MTDPNTPAPAASEIDADFLWRMKSCVLVNMSGDPCTDEDEERFWALAKEGARHSAAPAPAGDAVERVAEALRGWLEKHGWNLDIEDLARVALAAMPERVELARVQRELREQRQKNVDIAAMWTRCINEMRRLEAALTTAEARGMMHAAGMLKQLADTTQETDHRSDSISFISARAYRFAEQRIRAAASQPVEAVREDAPRVVDNPEAGYSEWLREDVPVFWVLAGRTALRVEIAFAINDHRFVGVRWPLARDLFDARAALARRPDPAPATPVIDETRRMIHQLDSLENAYEALGLTFKLVGESYGFLPRLRSVLTEHDAVVASRSGGKGDFQQLRFQHLKTGGFYRVIAAGARLQTAEPIPDMTNVTIYRSEKDGSVWARPADEFMDGRFVPAPPAADHGGEG